MPLSPLDRLEKQFPARGSATLHWSSSEGLSSVFDQVVVESPLGIEISYIKNGLPVRQLLGITMRTPGNDEELALGLLRAEGLIASLDEIEASFSCDQTCHGEAVDTWCVALRQSPRGDFKSSSRTLITTSACGFCGRENLENLPFDHTLDASKFSPISCGLIATLPQRLREFQANFSATGGCHGAAILSATGELELIREDVGRHNAVDKLVGVALQKNISLKNKILVLSGRASFELLQKASVAQFSVVISVGAPSSAAVELAHSAGITLVGFAREDRFNLYTHVSRIDINAAVMHV